MRIAPSSFRHLLTAVALTAIASAHAATQYTVTDLGTFGGTASDANGINNLGQVTGRAHFAGNTSAHAFLYTPGSALQDLGTLGGQFSNGYAINNLGQVAGHSLDIDNSTIPFVYTPGSGLRVLDTLGGMNNSGLNGINDSGLAVGWSSVNNNSDSPIRAVAYAPGQSAAQDLGALGGSQSSALGLNNVGQIVGWGQTAGDLVYHATLFDAINGNRDLGTLGGDVSLAADINDAGLIAGTSFLVGNVGQHAFLFKDGVGFQDLGTLAGDDISWGNKINNLGQVIGGSRDTQQPATSDHPFVYIPGQGLLDLNASLVAGSQAYIAWASDINDKGQIVGDAWINGELHAVVLNPTTVNAVPEPESYALMLLGLVGVAAVKRRKTLA